MDRVLLIGGSKDANNKIDRFNLAYFECLDSSFFTLTSLENSDDPSLKSAAKKLKVLIESKDVRIRSNMYFISDIARVCHLSYSLRTRIKVELFWHYRILNINSLKSFLKFLFTKRVLIMYLSFLLGVLRFPKKLLMYFLKIKLADRSRFLEVLNDLNLSEIIVFSTGYDNLIFLLSTIKKKPNVKFTIIISNWDNTSSKAIIPKIFDKICLWNYDQIEDIRKFSKLKKSNIVVLGSKTADEAYSKYHFDNDFQSKNQSKSILFIGQQNKCDEISELIKIGSFLDSTSTPYKNLVYRPHPLSGHQNKMLNSILDNKINIGLEVNPSIDLRLYSGIISFPTTFLLEAILSGVPTVVYTPRHNKYRRDPHSTWKYYHWNSLKKILPIPTLTNFSDLCTALQNGLPSQSPLIMSQFGKIFPNLDGTFELRLKNELTFNSKL